MHRRTSKTHPGEFSATIYAFLILTRSSRGHYILLKLSWWEQLCRRRTNYFWYAIDVDVTQPKKDLIRSFSTLRRTTGCVLFVLFSSDFLANPYFSRSSPTHHPLPHPHYLQSLKFLFDFSLYSPPHCLAWQELCAQMGWHILLSETWQPTQRMHGGSHCSRAAWGFRASEPIA